MIFVSSMDASVVTVLKINFLRTINISGYFEVQAIIRLHDSSPLQFKQEYKLNYGFSNMDTTSVLQNCLAA